MIETHPSKVPARPPEPSTDDLVRVLGPDGRIERPRIDPGLSIEEKRALLEAMMRSRILDDQLQKLQRQGRIAFHVGARGEEAAILGSASALRDVDWIVPCYREVSTALMRGWSLESYVDSMFGNASDPAKGHQMPDHSTCRAVRYASVSAPIGTQISHAVGMAWAAKKKGKDETVAVFFGDGATSSNDFHAGMTFAGVWKAPVLFLCRNNRWAISLPSEKQSAAKHIVDKAVGYGITGVRCDGNDALAVHAVVKEARERARAGQGPTLVELMTYREGGHSTSDDPTIYRSDEEVAAWARMDPILRFRLHLESIGAWPPDEESKLRAEVDREIKAAVAAAESKPKPTLGSMFDDVYAERPWHLEEQYEECARGRRPEGG